MKKALIGAAAIALIAVAPAAFAATQNGTLTVTASVAANCTISAATLGFGAYDPVVANTTNPLDGSTTMSVACTKGVTPKITTATAGSTITNGTDNLNYSLFSNSTRTTDFAGGFDLPTATSKAPQTLTIYGRIPGAQDVSAGAYTGTISVTVNF